ncbi:MAG: hypothetical protein JST42_22135 [Bacteroidetes bacterium]|nr:hypothetical protein [Bacteroidota bacterium]
MKRNLSIAIAAVLLLSTWACSKNIPVDGDGLLITTRRECSVSSFELLGTDFVSVRVGAAVIDTVAQTVTCTVQFGTDLRNLYPQFSLAQDCTLNPKITGLTDFSDLAHPRQWTVISGDRQIKKTYTVTLTVQPR